MENKKMKNVANFFSTVAKLGKTLCFVLSIVCVVFALLILIIGKNMIANFTLNFGELTLYFKEGYPINEKLLLAQVATELFILSLVFLAISYASKTLYVVIEPVKEGRPFEDSTTKGLRKLAWFSLIIGALGEVTKLVNYIFTSAAFDFNELFNGIPWVDSYNFEYQIDFSFVIMFCILMFLSFVFQYGQQLQKESDETL